MDERTNVVLCGDPQQLPPVVHSRITRSLGLGISLMERLMELDLYDEDGTRGQMGLT